VFDVVPTGVSGLDDIIGGGLLRPSAIGLLGDVGSNKSLLARQIAWNLLQRGFTVLYYPVDESADEVRKNMQTYNWDIKYFEENEYIEFIDVFSKGAETLNAQHSDDPDDYIEQTFDINYLLKQGQDYCIRKMVGKDLLVIVDSITPMLTLLDSQKAFHFLHTMKYITRASRAIGIAIIDLGIYDTKLEESCKQVADTIIELKSMGKEHINNRLIRIIKNAELFRSTLPV
jgi:circadian clock protein KaiC